MKILSAPINNLFFDCVKNATQSIQLCAPFVKKSVIDSIYKNIHKNNVSLDLITNNNINYFHKGASDLSALKVILSNNGNLYDFKQLHAKIYIFDGKMAIITSANLTYSGFNKNYEYGVLIDDQKHLNEIIADYDAICSNEKISKTSQANLEKIEIMLGEMPKHQRTDIKIETENDYFIDSKIEANLLLNNKILSGWKRDIFEVLNQLQMDTFGTEDYLKFIPRLKEKHPANNRIEDKIRQVLQQLRDIGLLRFEGQGRYTKLWE